MCSSTNVATCGSKGSMHCNRCHIHNLTQYDSRINSSTTMADMKTISSITVNAFSLSTGAMSQYNSIPKVYMNGNTFTVAVTLLRISITPMSESFPALLSL